MSPASPGSCSRRRHSASAAPGGGRGASPARACTSSGASPRSAITAPAAPVISQAVRAACSSTCSRGCCRSAMRCCTRSRCAWAWASSCVCRSMSSMALMAVMWQGPVSCAGRCRGAGATAWRNASLRPCSFFFQSAASPAQRQGFHATGQDGSVARHGAPHAARASKRDCFYVMLHHGEKIHAGSGIHPSRVLEDFKEIGIQRPSIKRGQLSIRKQRHAARARRPRAAPAPAPSARS